MFNVVRISVISLCLVVLFVSGCATSMTLSHPCPWNPKIYSGTRMDSLVFKEPKNEAEGWLRAFFGGAMFIDLPFSFVADTVLLPITVPWAAYDKMTEDPSEDRRNNPCLLTPHARGIADGTVKLKKIVNIGDPFLQDVVYTIDRFPTGIWHVGVYAEYTDGTLSSIHVQPDCQSNDPEVIRVEENRPGSNDCAVSFLKPGKATITTEYGQLRYSKEIWAVERGDPRSGQKLKPLKEIVDIGPPEFIGKPEVVYYFYRGASLWVNLPVVVRDQSGSVNPIREPMRCISSHPEVVRVEQNLGDGSACRISILNPGRTSLTVEYGTLRYAKDIVVKEKRDDNIR